MPAFRPNIHACALPAIAVILATAAAAIAPASAQQALAPLLATCRAIENDGARLQCYDEMSVVQDANSSAAIEPTAQEYAALADKLEAEARENFGLAPDQVKAQQPTEAQAGPSEWETRIEEASRPPSEMVAKLASYRQTARGRYVITLDNGQVWQETSSGFRAKLQPGDTITVTESSFGGYRLRVEGGRSFARVKRIR